MSPPNQTVHSRNKLHFRLFYTVVHVFVLMNVIIFWAVLVPMDMAICPREKKAKSSPVSFRLSEPVCSTPGPLCSDMTANRDLVEDFFTSEVSASSIFGT